MAASQTKDAPVTVLFDLIASHRITACISVAAKLGIADQLVDGPKTSAEIAREIGAHEPSLKRLLIALVTIGVCRKADGDRFALTAIGVPLAATSNPSIRGFAIFEGEMLWRWWGGLGESIRTGKTGPELAGIVDPFDLMAQSPEEVEIFNQAMVSLTRVVTPAVLAAYDFSGIGRLIDVGGGFGELLAGILKAHPAMRGIVFDLARCAEGAKRQFATAGVGERASFVEGNFFEKIPAGSDALILKSIIHDWNDGLGKKILRNCRAALAANGKLLLVERLMPDDPADNPADRSQAMSDLNMLRGLGGAELTADGYGTLLGEAGFCLTKVLPAGRFHVLEALPA